MHQVYKIYRNCQNIFFLYCFFLYFFLYLSGENQFVQYKPEKRILIRPENPTQMDVTPMADPDFPIISFEPGKFKRWGRSCHTSRGIIKTANDKYMAIRIGEGMAECIVHLYLTGGPGNDPTTIFTRNNRILKGTDLALLPGQKVRHLFTDERH